KSIYLSSASNDCTITNNIISYANSNGIAIAGSSGDLVRSNVVPFSNDHGVLLTGATNATVQDNESSGNARPVIRAANGINLTGSTGNLIQGNRLHDNQD